MYYELYEVCRELFFGLGAELTQYQDLVLNLLSMVGCVALVALPFVVIYKITVWIGGGFR